MSLIELPDELIICIVELLDWRFLQARRDVLALYSTCKRFAMLADCRFSKIFRFNRPDLTIFSVDTTDIHGKLDGPQIITQKNELVRFEYYIQGKSICKLDADPEIKMSKFAMQFAFDRIRAIDTLDRSVRLASELQDNYLDGDKVKILSEPTEKEQQLMLNRLLGVA